MQKQRTGQADQKAEAVKVLGNKEQFRSRRMTTNSERVSTDKRQEISRLRRLSDETDSLTFLGRAVNHKACQRQQQLLWR